MLAGLAQVKDPQRGCPSPSKAQQIDHMRSSTSNQALLPGLTCCLQDADKFDTVCLATCMHKLANLRGAPNLHAQIVQAPEFYKLKHLIG